MVKQKNYVVVNYRLEETAVQMLRDLKNGESELYGGKTLTWLVENAIRQYYGPVLKPHHTPPASNGNA